MNILAFFAHPDDETMLTGGSLALLERAGAQVHYVCATRGEGGELGDPPVCRRDQIGIHRQGELTCAVQALRGASLTFLNHLDPLVGAGETLYAYTDDLEKLVNQISQVLLVHQPEAVITHGSRGEYGHPGHILTHQAVRKAVESLRQDAPLLYTFCANYPGHPSPRHANPDDPADIILDVSSVMEQKARAAYCHRSQHALFLRRRSAQAGYRMTIPEVLLKLESLHRAFPPVNSQPDDRVFQMLKPWSIKQAF